MEKKENDPGEDSSEDEKGKALAKEAKTAETVVLPESKKKTDRPKKPLTEKQREALARGREAGIKKQAERAALRAKQDKELQESKAQLDQIQIGIKEKKRAIIETALQEAYKEKALAKAELKRLKRKHRKTRNDSSDEESSSESESSSEEETDTDEMEEEKPRKGKREKHEKKRHKSNIPGISRVVNFG